VDNLLGLYCSREKYQRSMVVYDNGVCIFRDGMLVGVLESNRDRGLVLDTFTSPTIPQWYFTRGYDGHEDNVTNPRGILNIPRSGSAFEDITKQFLHFERRCELNWSMQHLTSSNPLNADH
jgi:hypothetical protein